jgi:serine kinase of HPr protein (carbohydrate metabolism regulator)
MKVAEAAAPANGPNGRNAAANMHCCVVEIAGAGILIEGVAGSGKTSLALGLIDAAARRGVEAHFVADDQALLERSGGDVLARVPASIAGLAEVRGHGIVPVKHREACKIGLVVRLAADESIERMPAGKTCDLLGVTIPVVNTPMRHEAQAVRIVLASLHVSLV